MPIYQQLKHIETQYNIYELTKEEALKQAQPWIDKFNEISRRLAKKSNQVPTIMKASKFSFGK